MTKLLLPIVPKWNWNDHEQIVLILGASYQSYQSGIETGYYTKSSSILLHYQSYQSGIETPFHRSRLFVTLKPTNRTKVELKLRYHERSYQSKWSYQSYQSGIETGVTFKRCSEPCPTNRTKVELKLETRSHNLPVVALLPIVPKWNWNALSPL